MKKFILAALAASVALSPMAASGTSAHGRQQERRTTVVKRNGNVVKWTVVRQQAPLLGERRMTAPRREEPKIGRSEHPCRFPEMVTNPPQKWPVPANECAP